MCSLKVCLDGRGTSDIMFVWRHMQGAQPGLHRSNQSLWHSRNGLWRILSQLGCPPRFIILKQLHEDQKGPIRYNGDLPANISIENGVKQDFVLPPTLCHILRINAKQNEATPEWRHQVPHWWQHVVNMRHLLSRTKSKTATKLF